MADKILDWIVFNIFPWALVVGCVVVAIILLMGVFYLVMSFFKEPVPTRGIVVRKDYRQAYTSYALLPVGDTTTLIPNYYPEVWDIVIVEQGYRKEYCISVSKEVWGSLKVGDVYNA